VEVTVARKLRRPALRACRTTIPADEVTTQRGIPVTSVARTLYDLATVVGPEELEHAFNEAEVRRLTSSVSLADLVARCPHRKGNAAIRRVLVTYAAIGGPLPAAGSSAGSSRSSTPTRCRVPA
jgi:hypothetical protein